MSNLQVFTGMAFSSSLFGIGYFTFEKMLHINYFYMISKSLVVRRRAFLILLLFFMGNLVFNYSLFFSFDNTCFNTLRQLVSTLFFFDIFNFFVLPIFGPIPIPLRKLNCCWRIEALCLYIDIRHPSLSNFTIFFLYISM